ncbi:uncharacterized protein LOC109821743 [Asparagus officinalis]|uniref:uncharacterized protein LOC109821743 n=1 Tax=Asparagus officinalis TaxID=4686 RepID=UPI00098E5DC2|nr:uncharacterized protein LOC109821743 [Asparagus officinalis]
MAILINFVAHPCNCSAPACLQGMVRVMPGPARSKSDSSNLRGSFIDLPRHISSDECLMRSSLHAECYTQHQLASGQYVSDHLSDPIASFIMRARLLWLPVMVNGKGKIRNNRAFAYPAVGRSSATFEFKLSRCLPPCLVAKTRAVLTPSLVAKTIAALLLAALSSSELSRHLHLSPKNPDSSSSDSSSSSSFSSRPTARLDIIVAAAQRSVAPSSSSLFFGWLCSPLLRRCCLLSSSTLKGNSQEGIEGQLDEGFLAEVNAQLRQSKEDGDKSAGLEAMLQKVLQIYAFKVLQKRSYAYKGMQICKRCSTWPARSITMNSLTSCSSIWFVSLDKSFYSLSISREVISSLFH